MYKVKYHSDETIVWFKAHLLDKGYIQAKGLYYIEIFAPVAKLVAICYLILVAVLWWWPFLQLDIHYTFLHGNLHEKVYM